MNFLKELQVGGKNFKLRQIDPGYTGKLTKEQSLQLQSEHQESLRQLQDRFYAEARHAVLLILQGIDASGKDGIIKHVMSGVNPASCHVISFKAPTAREMRHGFLWRHMVATPERGYIGIFNRSHYEEVLIVRVHPELLKSESLPKEIESDPDIWNKRYCAINAFEQYLVENGVRVVKILLHISKEEQGRRFLKRLGDEEKNWKFSLDDLKERAFWPKYQEAFEQMIRHTSTAFAPWHVVPADHKWFARTAVGDILVRTLQEIHPCYPQVTAEKKRELRALHDTLRKDLA